MATASLVNASAPTSPLPRPTSVVTAAPGGDECERRSLSLPSDMDDDTLNALDDLFGLDGMPLG